MAKCGVTMPYELLDEGAPETALGYAGRTAGRTLARGAEAVVGLPGDIISGIGNLANAGIKAVTGHEIRMPETGLPLPGVISNRSTRINPLPTSQEIRENVTKPLTGEYLEPHTENEKFYDDIVSDAATMFIPVKGKVPFAKAALGALGKSIAGNAAQWATEKVSGSPLLGAAAKIGGIALASTMGGRRELSKIKDQSYAEAFSKLPSDTVFDFKPEKTTLEKLGNTLIKGDRPDKKFLLERIAAANDLISKADIGNVQELINLKQDWNAHLLNPEIAKSSKDILKHMVGTVNSGIKRFGAQNPEFYKPYVLGEELTGAMRSSNYVQRFMAKHPFLQEKASNPVIKHLMLGGLYSGVGYAGSKIGIPAAAAIGAGAAGIMSGAKAYQLLARSPYARQYYKNIVAASLKNDTKAAAKNLAKLNKVADKSGYELVD